MPAGRAVRRRMLSSRERALSESGRNSGRAVDERSRGLHVGARGGFSRVRRPAAAGGLSTDPVGREPDRRTKSARLAGPPWTRITMSKSTEAMAHAGRRRVGRERRQSVPERMRGGALNERLSLAHICFKTRSFAVGCRKSARAVHLGGESVGLGCALWPSHAALGVRLARRW